MLEIISEFATLARSRVHDWLSNSDPTGVLRSLILSNTGPGLSLSEVPEALQLLRLLGFVHVASAAGTHLYRLGDWVANLGARRRLALVLSGVLWSIVWLLAGFRFSFLRPWILVLFRTVGQTIGVRWNSYLPLGSSFVLEVLIRAILCQEPLERVIGPHAGIWVYTLAVGGGMAGYQMSGTHLGRSFGSFIGVAVFEGIVRGHCAPVILLWNAVTLGAFVTLFYPPLVGVAIGVACFGTFSGAEVVPKLASVVMTSLLDVSLRLPSVVFFHPVWLSASLGLGFIAVLLPRRRALWIGIITLVLCAARLAREASPSSDTHIAQWRLRTGEAALIHAPEFAALADVGSRRSYTVEGLMHRLASNRIAALDRVLISHFHEDHAGALPLVHRLIPIGCLSADPLQIRYAREHLPAYRHALEIPLCTPVASPFLFTHTIPNPLEPLRSGQLNRQMLTFAFRVPGRAIYVNLGDAEGREEERHAAAIREWMDTFHFKEPIVFKASHHGSKTSNSARTLALLQPRRIWISASDGAKYGHPHAGVVRRLRSLAVPMEMILPTRRLSRGGVAPRRPRARHP